jgi:hypothetical protein
MSLLELALLGAAALEALGAAAFALRRSLRGAVTGTMLVLGGAVQAVVAITVESGRSSSLGQVAAVALVGMGAALAAAFLALARAVRGARAGRETSA